uniref:Secreted protein n=1 Tax=Physcomitrium patens TaxID=3218 RepID=A0A2K1IFE7_PHYPA|nr:hypothetical protein PHYPA_028593 [Physcomitrium patens]
MVASFLSFSAFFSCVHEDDMSLCGYGFDQRIFLLPIRVISTAYMLHTSGVLIDSPTKQWVNSYQCGQAWCDGEAQVSQCSQKTSHDEKRERDTSTSSTECR